MNVLFQNHECIDIQPIYIDFIFDTNAILIIKKEVLALFRIHSLSTLSPAWIFPQSLLDAFSAYVPCLCRMDLVFLRWDIFQD